MLRREADPLNRRRVVPGNGYSNHELTQYDKRYTETNEYHNDSRRKVNNRQYAQLHENGEMSDNQAATIIQRAVRRHMVSKYWTFLLQFFMSWSIAVQAMYRGRKARFSYNLLRELLSRSQALVRGWLVRRTMHKIRKNRLTAYRAQVFELWRRSYTPLSYRVRFWTYINRYRFLHLALHEDELLKLWEALGLKRLVLSRPKQEQERLKNATPPHENLRPRSCHLFLEERFGYRSVVIQQRFKVIQRKLDSVKMEHRQLDLLPVFPTEFALCKEVTVSLHREDPTNNLAVKTQNLREARDKLQQERDNMYRALKVCKKTHPGTWAQIYTSMKIPEAVQQKKTKVVKLLWEHPAYAKTSLQVYFMTEGPNQRWGQQGGTGGSGLTTEYSAKIMDARRSMIELKDCLQSLKSLRRLRLDRKGVHFRMQRRAIVAGMKVTDWLDQRAILMGGYLYGCGDKKYDPLAARMMLLRRMNARRRRTGTGDVNSHSKNNRSQSTKTNATIQISQSTFESPYAESAPPHVSVAPQAYPLEPMERPAAQSIEGKRTDGDSASNSSSPNARQKSILTPLKNKSFALRLTKSTSSESGSQSQSHNSGPQHQVQGNGQTRRVQSLRQYDPVRNISYSEQAPEQVFEKSFPYNTDYIEEGEEEIFSGHSSHRQSSSRSDLSDKNHRLARLERELLDF